MGTAVRDLGKPGTSKLENIIGTAITITPYANIGFQASARLIRAARENPLGTAATVAMGIAPIAMLGFANAVRLDKELEERGEEPRYTKYDLSRPGWDSTRMIPIYIDGIEPDHAPRFRIDPLISLPYTLFREMMVRIDNFAGDLSRDPILGESRDAIVHIAGERMRGNMMTSIFNALPANQVPPIVGAGAAVLGFQIPEYAKLVGRGASPINQGGLGGFENTRLAGGVINRTWEAIIGSLAGSAGMTWVGAINQGAINERTNSGTFAAGVANELGGKARARLPELQSLWQQPQQRASNDQFADTINAKENKLREFQTNQASINTPDTVGRGRTTERVEPGSGRAGVQDPQMRQVMNVAMEFGRAMQPLQEARGKLRDMLISVDQSPANRDYVTRLTERNRIASEISRVNAELLSKYTAFEERLSQRTGYAIRIEQIDPTKPITQFRPVSQ